MTAGRPQPPYSIRTERLLLRCPDPADAALVRALTAVNKEHLAPWMPWAHEEPQTVEEKAALLRRFRGRFDLGRDFPYGVFDGEDAGRMLGGTGLHRQTERGSFEIGYWIDREHVGRGLATELTAALVRVGFELAGAERIEIRCAPTNLASLRVPQKLGFEREGLLRGGLAWHDGTRRDQVVWGLLAEDYARSPSAGARVEAFDALGSPMELRS